MREFVVNNKPFTTICSVHNEILDIVNKLVESGLQNESINQLNYIGELTQVAKYMGQTMEDALKNRHGDFYFNNLYNFSKFIYQQNPDPEENDE